MAATAPSVGTASVMLHTLCATASAMYCKAHTTGILGTYVIQGKHWSSLSHAVTLEQNLEQGAESNQDSITCWLSSVFCARKVGLQLCAPSKKVLKSMVQNYTVCTRWLQSMEACTHLTP